MMNFFKYFTFAAFKKAGKEPEQNDFSEFFTDADSKKKAKIIHEVLREANAEQKKMVDVYRERAETATR